MAPNLWHERVTIALGELPSRSFLRCSRDSGIEYAIERLRRRDTPVISIWIPEAVEAVEIGLRLSEAVTAGLGASLFRENVPYSQGLRILADYQRVVGPISIVIGWYSQCHSFVDDLHKHLVDESSLLVVEDLASSMPAPDALELVDGSFLQMRVMEAIREARGIVADDEVRELYRESDGQYANFKQLLLERLESDELGVGDCLTRSWSEGINISGLIDALLAREKWDDAFELASLHAPDRLVDFIDEAGKYYAKRGAYEYLWARLSALPPDLKRIEKIAYWMATAGLATNRQGPVVRLSEELLRRADAPELRAATAVAAPSDSMLAETSRAVQALRSTATLRAHGFALAWAGKGNEAMLVLREALRLAEQDGAHHLVVACGIDIAEVENRQGHYKRGVEWSTWAKEEYQRRGLREQLRYFSAAATLSYSLLLLGDLEGAASALKGLKLSADYDEVPGFEAVVSTKADIALLQGHHDEALELYTRNHDRAPIEAHCFTALDILCAHVSKNEWDEAIRVAEMGFAISRSSTAFESALGELLMGIALSEAKPVLAESHLLSAIDGLNCTTSEVHHAQAAIWLAIARLNMNRRKDAASALRLGANGLIELGELGWQLLGGCHRRVEEARSLWKKTEFDFELILLGDRVMRSGSEEVGLSLRAAELIAALAAHPHGLSGERLHALIYGDAEYNSTLKANISKLRAQVPIGSNPYRLEANIQADFVLVLELISNGEVQRALNLYKGPLLPDSEAPFIQEWRDHIDEVLRNAIIESGDVDLLIQYGTLLDDDLAVWERARDIMALSDYRRPVVNARIRRIRTSWKAD